MPACNATAHPAFPWYHARRPQPSSATLERVDTFRAEDLTDEHLGQYLRGEGVEGVLRHVLHRDGVTVDLVLDREPFVVSLPAGRPVEVTSP